VIADLPVTWLVHDALVTLLYVACVVHASRRRDDPLLPLVMLLGFTLFTGAFENLGVWTGRYDYSDHRVAMIGNVPLGVLLLESVILYGAVTLLRHLRVPAWALPFAAGFLTAFQDLSIDPTAVHDRYLLDGVEQGQWTWAQHYTGTYVGIPFANFTGWFWFTAAYLIAFQAVLALYRRRRPQPGPVAEWSMPFLATLGGMVILVVPTTAFLIDLSPFVAAQTRWAELTMLILNLTCGLVLLIATAKRVRPFLLRRDGLVIFVFPLVLRLYDLVVAFARGLSIASVPSVLLLVAHLVFFGWLLLTDRAGDGEPGARGALVPAGL
jgi:uncharacterized membrane protein